MSEYGFQGMPSRSSFDEFTFPDDLKFTTVSKKVKAGENENFSSIIRLHQKHPTGFETIDEYCVVITSHRKILKATCMYRSFCSVMVLPEPLRHTAVQNRIAWEPSTGS
jgi:hypothetical protein